MQVKTNKKHYQVYLVCNIEQRVTFWDVATSVLSSPTYKQGVIVYDDQTLDWK